MVQIDANYYGELQLQRDTFQISTEAETERARERLRDQRLRLIWSGRLGSSGSGRSSASRYRRWILLDERSEEWRPRPQEGNRNYQADSVVHASREPHGTTVVHHDCLC